MREREQSIKDQNHETAFIYDEDGNLLGQWDGDENHVGIKYPPHGAYFLTHNHNNNSSFSRADLLFLLNNLDGGIRAIGPNGIVFEMRINKNALEEWLKKGGEGAVDRYSNWKKLNKELINAWEWAETMARAEMKSYLMRKYPVDHDVWLYWKEKDKAMLEAKKHLGGYSERINKHLVTKTPIGRALFEYKKYE